MDDIGQGAEPESPQVAPPGQREPASRFKQLPRTSLGRWAMWLVVAYLVMFYGNYWLGMSGVVPPSARVVSIVVSIASLIAGFAAGALAVIAMISERERSWVLWIASLVMVNVLLLLVGEFVLSALVPALRH